jgi:anti-sigma28 factor (negative regulator of flagellin synthesis)
MCQEAMSSYSSAILSMKVTQTNNKSIAGLDRAANAASGRTGSLPEASAQAGAGDQTQISRLSTYLAAAMSGSPMHVAKLSALGAAVSSGQYNVDASAVSNGVIQHSLLFSGAW